MFCSVCLCSFILQFYVLDFLLNCSFLFTDKLLCLVVHEIDYRDPEEYEVAEAKVQVAEAKVKVAEAKVEVAKAKVEVAKAKVEVAEAKVKVAEVKVEVAEAKVEARFREMMLQQWLLSDEVEEGRRVATVMQQQQRL